MIPLETISTIPRTTGSAIAMTLIAALGILCILTGRMILKEPTPRFVMTYRGWSSILLSLPYAGAFLLLAASISFQPPLPRLILFLESTAFLLCLLIGLLSIFIWFPRFLLPRWYPRAVKAGVPRNDPFLMGAFKALPRSEQLELLHHTTTPDAAPAADPAAEPISAPHPSSERFPTPTPAARSSDTPHTGFGRGIISGLTPGAHEEEMR